MIAISRAKEMGNDGQDYTRFDLALDGARVMPTSEGTVYEYADGSAILDCGGGGWDIATECHWCKRWYWLGSDECQCNL